MPRGGHRAAILPISGLHFGPGRPHSKRGLYFHKRENIFTPRWGLRREAFNHSKLPDGGTLKWEPDSDKAWPFFGKEGHLREYCRNELRYLIPATGCIRDPHLRTYILKMLGLRSYESIQSVQLNSSEKNQHFEGSSSFSDILFNGKNPNNFLLHIESIAKEVGLSYESSSSRHLPLVEDRIRNLDNIISKANIWRSKQNTFFSSSSSSNSNTNVFPFVDDKAALIRDLPLSEILYSVHSQRVKSRRHPYWMDVRFKKDRYKIPYLYRSN